MAERATLAVRRPEVVDDACAELARVVPSMADYDDHQREHTRRDLAYTLQFLDAALLVDDPTLFTEYVDWLTALLTHRGVPADAVARSLTVLRSAIGADLPRARALLDLAGA